MVNANSVGPDQTPRFAESVLGLHCFPKYLLWVFKLNGLNLSLLVLFVGCLHSNRSAV